MATATQITLKTETYIGDASTEATFSIWLNNESEAYTLRVKPLTAEQIEDRRIDFESDDTHVLTDGYTEDLYYASFEDAISAAWGFFQETQSENLEQAGY